MTTPVYDNVKVDRTLWDKLRAKAKKLYRMYVKVGILASKGGEQTHPDSEMSLIEIMATHEFGSSDDRVPERRPLRKTFQDGEGPRRTADVIAKLARKIITEDMDPERALKVLGTWAVKEVKNTITSEDLPPPLAESTVEAKGSTKPLVDTGLLLNSIAFEVVTNDSAEGSDQ